MGFLSDWAFSGLSTTQSKKTKIFWEIGYAIKTDSYDEFIKVKSHKEAVKIVLNAYDGFVKYLIDDNKSAKEDAGIFLVIFAAYAHGYDGLHWDWQNVRHFSQGLWGSLEETPNDFKLYNLPLIENFIDRIDC